jgi:hypothetical protein
MFDSYKLNQQVSSLEKTVEKKEALIKERDEVIKELELEAKNQVKEFESKERILRAELKIEVANAVEQEKVNTQLVREENSVLKKEVAILNKAFENMGFDVKDMKEILNKLVDGLIAKNEIKLVK